MPIPANARLGLPRRLAAITAGLAILLVAGATELALRLAERNRLADLRKESVELATTFAAYLTRIAPTGDPGALAVGLSGWSRRHITETTAIVFLTNGMELMAGAASDSTVDRGADAADSGALALRAPVVRFHSEPAPAWQVAVPLGGEQPFGVLDVRVLTGRLGDWARDERRRALAMALGSALLLAAGVAWLTSRWVGRPLNALATAMAAAHGGAQGSPAAPELGPPEFRDVARRYNQLRAALALRERESEARAALLTLAEQAKAYDRLALSDETAAGFAHEIGTPLNTMSGHLQLLRDDLRQRGDTEGVERVQLLLAQVDRMAKSVRGGLERTLWPVARALPTDLAVVAGRMLDFLAPALESARVSATASRPSEGLAPVLALADPDLVEQILLNLLKNAIEAVGSGGRIRVETSREDGRAILEVADNGPGLGPDARAHLFQPFVTSKGQGGSGLGLAVSRRLARTLGGELVYVPTALGTHWRLTLPLIETA